MKITSILDAEIEASKRSARPINLHLCKQGDGIYKAISPFKVEGDYILSSANIVDKAVFVEYNKEKKSVTIDLDSEENEINAFLTKDKSSLLKAIKQNLKSSQFPEKPAFIVGPPGTGKTKVITKIIEDGIKANKKILIASPTNLAVENVFEKLNIKELDLNDGEIVLTIKTNLEILNQFKPEEIKKRKIEPIEDEVEILSIAQKDLLQQRRDAQPILDGVKSKRASYDTIIANLKRDLSSLKLKQKEIKAELDKISNRVNTLNSNALLKSVANMFMQKKVKELENEKTLKIDELEKLKVDITKLEKKIASVLCSSSKIETKVLKANQEIVEANNALTKISSRLQELRKEKDEIQSNNIFNSAKIVGATLINAALNQKIQAGEFDLVIVDEASMGLVPLLLVVSQSLREKSNSSLVEYEYDSSFTEAQNRAIELGLNKRFLAIGDPRQLQPIAKTYEMRESIFDVYGVNEIFNGISIEDTVFLDINFRNHPHIASLASNLFYGNMLKSGKEDDNRDSIYIRRSTSKMVSSKGSYVNHGNMRIVVEQIARALEKGRRNIGVITPYRKQAQLIEENISSLRKDYPDADIQAGTVHTFQGKEKDIIIFDITFSPSEYNNYAIPATYNGDNNSNVAKLLNVAMTRAKEFFIVVGDTDGISKLDKNLALVKWIQEIEKLQ